MGLFSFAFALCVVRIALASASSPNAPASPTHGEQDVNVSLEAASGDSCSTGLIGMALSKYPEAQTCLAPCHSSCPALNAIMTAYMTQGGQPAAIRSACQHSSGLTCLFSHVDPCRGLVAKAKGFGMTIPTSQSELNSMCNRRLRGDSAVGNLTNGTQAEVLNPVDEPEPVASVPILPISASYAAVTNTQDVNASLEAASGDSCSTGLIGTALSKYPEVQTCLAPCHSSCPALNAIMTAYLTQGGQPAAIRSACQHSSGLTCLFSHVDPCRGLVAKAKGFGMTIPTSQSELNSMCNRRLRGDSAVGNMTNSTQAEVLKPVDILEPVVPVPLVPFSVSNANGTTVQDVNVSLEAASGDSCSTGLIGMAMSKSPEATTCLAPCHSSCPALNAIMTAYMRQGGQPAAIRTACQHRSGLMCLFRHVDPCRGLVHKAKGFGMTIPTSESQLNSMCR